MLQLQNSESAGHALGPAFCRTLISANVVGKDHCLLDELYISIREILVGRLRRDKDELFARRISCELDLQCL